MGAAEVAGNVRSVTNVTPQSEGVARAVASAPVEQQATAWQQAVATAPDGKVTAAHVYKIVKGMTHQEPPPKC